MTHPHAEGQAGAIAVAAAAGWASRRGHGERQGSGRVLLEVTLEHTPPGETRRGFLALCVEPAFPQTGEREQAVVTRSDEVRLLAAGTLFHPLIETGGSDQAPPLP